ncbi:kinase-like domain-containing protein [Rhizophagus irregularis DAOM 181602=DAOM 197198]|nr:kinase-like domain-containing protein [Rhizophagus irregularis DAOM 181602=DAOM 197198]
MSLNNISKDDENFLKNFLKGFYRQIINIENYTKYENILSEWIQEFLIYNGKNPEIILKLMKDHKENENWFSCLIGFFYESDIEFKHLENMNTMSYYQFENFNGLEINLCKDELNNMEKYFDLLDKNSIERNINKKELDDLAEQEYKDAQFQLGNCYDQGIGTEVNKTKAFEMYKIAAEKEHDIAQNNLGSLFVYGKGEYHELGKGICKNTMRAIEFYKKSADQGFADAYYKLGHLYSNNGIQFDISKEKVCELYKIAAEGGNVEAQKSLASLYGRGEGTEKNIELAIYWYNKAAENGCQESKDNLDILLEEQE